MKLYVCRFLFLLFMFKLENELALKKKKKKNKEKSIYCTTAYIRDDVQLYV